MATAGREELVAAESGERFNDRFVRCLRLQYFIAGRILGGPEGTVEAVQNCYATASKNPPRFQYEGAFRSWLLRILIHEAVVLVRGRIAAMSCQETLFSQDCLGP